MSVRIMILSLIGSDLCNIYRIKQDNTALNIVEIRNYGPVIVKVNDTSHLDGISTITNSALE
jgi:probable phosphoglycerate mutase